MADKRLKSITFPRLPDRYVIPEVEVDTTLTQSGKAADAKAAGDALEQKANIDGYYQEMTVGDAEQLVATVGVTDKVPYLFRTSGGSADIGNRATDEIVGGSLVWNQLVQGGDFTDATKFAGQSCTLAVSGGKGTATLTAATSVARIEQLLETAINHVYIAFATFTSAKATSVRISTNSSPVWVFGGNDVAVEANTKTTIALMTKIGAAGTYLRWYFNRTEALAVGDTVTLENFMLIDLTAMFGSTIADYIYSLETATAGAGVAWFRKLFPKPYYAYNAGELLSVSGVSAHRMVGFNAYNHEMGTAVLLGGNQYQITGAYTALSYTDIGGNAEIITPDSNGLFTPSANGTLTVTGGNDTTTCVHLVWSGTHNGEYEPYEVHEYALDDSLTLRGIPKLDANNELYYDGDTYASDGTVTRYWTERAYQSGDVSDGSTMITDGTTTVYKLTTPTTETAEPFTNPQVVSDWGTEEYVTDSIVPVGHTTTYPANLRDKLQHLPDLADNDGNFLIQQTGTQMVLVPFRIQQATGADGTYVLKATVSGGTPTYTWVLEE